MHVQTKLKFIRILLWRSDRMSIAKENHRTDADDKFPPPQIV